jgi:hypothetical protein
MQTRRIPSAASLDLEVYDMPHQQKSRVETVTDRPGKSAAYRYSHKYWLVEAAQDALMVSSFGLWALLLGFLPVVAFCMLWGG